MQLFSKTNTIGITKQPKRLVLSPFKKLCFRTLLVFVLLMFALCAGFMIFSFKVINMTIPNPSPIADAIVVLTGGEKRVETGLYLLEKKRGARLLISGVNPITNRQALIRVHHADRNLFYCCVDLGHEALNTIGNAQETANWIDYHHYKNVYIVTNDYHMPRSLREMQRLMPTIYFIPYPIQTINKNNTAWISNYMQFRILVSEYLKFIGAEIRGWFF